LASIAKEEEDGSVDVETSKDGSDLTSTARLLERGLDWEAIELLEEAEAWTVLGTECVIVREGCGEIEFCAFLTWSAYERGESFGADGTLDETIRRQRKYRNWGA
jgi:hypothetical protein